MLANIQLSETGQRAHLIVGIPAHRAQTVVIEPGSSLFPDLLAYAEVDSQGTAVLPRLSREWDAIPSAAELLDAYRTREAEQEAEREAVRTEALAVLRDRRTHTRDEWVSEAQRHVGQRHPAWPHGTPNEIIESDEALAWREQLREEFRAACADAVAERREIEDANRRRKLAATAKAAEVVLEHGTVSQQERFAAGVLPVDELDDILRRVAFAPLAELPGYANPILRCGCDAGIDVSASESSEWSDAAWAVRARVLAALPDATCEYWFTEHSCGACGEVAAASSVVARLELGGRTVSTELAV